MIAIDLGTDGLDAQADAILEAGWVGSTPQAISVATAGRLRFRPEQKLSEQSVVIHHIMDDEAADGLTDALACAELFLAQRAKRGDAPVLLGDLLDH